MSWEVNIETLLILFNKKSLFNFFLSIKGKEQHSPIYISRIISGGVADQHGGLRRGDQLLSVNGVVSVFKLI